MGYNIEVSFNILKNSNVTELEDHIVSLAKECDCTFIYSNCEMENKLFMQRNHNVITSNFDNTNVNDLVKYIKTIKKIKGIYIESIYNEETKEIIYASQYYLTIMDKTMSKTYKLNKRNRSYSDDDIKIVNEIKK
jgi:hypothetical protein